MNSLPDNEKPIMLFLEEEMEFIESAKGREGMEEWVWEEGEDEDG